MIETSTVDVHVHILSVCTCTFFIAFIGVALMPAAKVRETVAGNTLSVTWPAPENTDFLMAYRVSYTSTSRIGTGGRRRRQASTPVTLRDIPATAPRSASLTFQPFSNYAVDVLAVYNPPPTNAEVTVILLPTTNFSTPERRKKLPGVANHTKAKKYPYLHT